MTEKRQFISCKFRTEDTRTFSYHNDGPPVAEGNVVLVPDKSGVGSKKVFVVTVDDPEPRYATKAIIDLHVAEEPAPDRLFDAAVAALS